MKKICVLVGTSNNKIIPTEMSIEFEPTESRDGKATLWCEKSKTLEGDITITKLTKKYRWEWRGTVIGSQNHHTLIKISTPRQEKIAS